MRVEVCVGNFMFVSVSVYVFVCVCLLVFGGTCVCRCLCALIESFVCVLLKKCVGVCV